MYVCGGIPDFLPESQGHKAEVYRVWVTPRLDRRWAEVDCSCGVRERAAWGPDTQTYRELVTAAWTCATAAAAVRR